MKDLLPFTSAIMARLTAAFCLASLLVAASAGPLQQQGERHGNGKHSSAQDTLRPIGNCAEKDNAFKSGQTYEYNYFGKAETGLGFGDSKTVGLALDCKVRLAVPQPCEYRMKVVSCEVFEHDGTGSEDDQDEQDGHQTLEEEVQALENREVSRRGFKQSDRSQEVSRMVSQHAIQAQVANGEVVRVVHEDEEETWVLNFKKAILDALQVDTEVASIRAAYGSQDLKMVNGVQGLCPTRVSEKSTTDNVIVEKDLDACIHAKKNSWTLSPLTPVWNMSMVSVVMKAESVCSYKLEHSSHIRSMTCRESHRLLPLPWKTQIAAATANITQTLRFIRKEANAEQIERSLNTKTVTSILYEHEEATDVDRKPGQGDADETLKDLVQKATDGFDIDAPATFDKFVDELRDSSDLEDVIATTRNMQHNEKEVAKYLLVQGLVQCNAPVCLRALVTLMQADEIPTSVFKPVVMALAFTKQQDPLFLREVKRICEARPCRTCTLMVGAMAHKMVEENEDILEDRETAEPIEEAAQFLIDLIDEDKCEPSDKLDKADEDSDATKLIIALKAIGNLGHVAQKIQASSSRRNSQSRIEEKIFRCITDTTVPDNVTIAAIHAFRRFVPTQQISDKLLAVLADHQETHQVRMVACMASVRMASDKTAVRNIVKVMENEKIDQVKAFMVSHLRNVIKSEDPHYKKVAEHLKQVLHERGQSDLPNIKARIPHSLHLEASKFYQVPFLDDEENEFGAQVESSVMFSTKSYLPKAFHLNVSTEIFGDYMNILETGVSMEGVENLVEKVLGPQGIISKSKYLKKAQDVISKMLEVLEQMGYRHFRLEDAKDFGRKFIQLIQSKEYGDIIDQVLSNLQDLDTTALTQIFSHVRNMDTEKIMETIRRNIPQSAQLTEVVEKLKRIRFQDASAETLVEVLKAFGITQEKSREIIAQAKNYGINVDQIAAWIRRTDFSQIKSQLESLRADDIQQKFQLAVEKVQELLRWISQKYNIPSFQVLVDMVKQVAKNPSQIKQLAESLLQSGRRDTNNRADNNDENDDEDDEDNQDEQNDYKSLDQMSWGSQVKKFKRGPRDEDRDGKDDDEDFDIAAFIRIFGDEIGFITLDDLTESFDLDLMVKSFDLTSKTWTDIADGFDIQPTVATKMEGLHHISTGLGLPLQITLNVTGIATLHIKAQPQGSSLKQSSIEFEPSGALQIVGGMSIDLPSIHSIAVVSNTTIKSEFEFKMRLDIGQDAIELNIEKPDEELDIVHIRHELKLVKDDEDIEAFDNAKSHEVKKEMCLPDVVEHVTGLKICSQLETSTLKGSAMLSHGPHELRISVKESQQTGLQHVKFAGKHNQQDNENRFEFNLRAPGHKLQREARALITHDRQRHNIQMKFDVAQQSTPRAHIFLHNLAGRDDIKFGVETGLDVQLADDKHYNASIIVLAKAKGYGYGNIVEMIKGAEFNYTLGASIQAPKVALNVTTTTAKVGQTFMMEHNLTYFISDEIRVPMLQKICFPGAEHRDGVSKFTLRHGVKVKSDRIAHDVRAFIQLLTFPLLEVAEPTIHHISQIKVHRDYRHIGLHSNTTWLNEQDEVEFFNTSATVNNLVDLTRLQEERAVRFNLNVSRNDWHVALENEVETKSGEISLTQELTGMAMIPECSSFIDCAWKRAKADAKTVVSVLKVKTPSASLRAHKHHKLRTADANSFRLRQLVVTVESKLKEKTRTSSENGFWNQRTSRAGQRAYQVETSVIVQKTGQAKMEMSGVTIIGNDAGQRGAIVSLYLVHNATATNIPFSFDHFSHILINKEDGIIISTNSSIDKNDQTFVDMDAYLQIDPKDMEIRGAVQLDTPVLDGTAEVEVKKSAKNLIEAHLTTKTESQSTMTQALEHDLKATIKLSAGKITQSLRLRHAKVESDLKVDFDLYGSQSDFEQTDGEENEDDEVDRNVSSSSRSSDARSSQKQETRRRAPRALSQRQSTRNNQNEQSTDNEADQDTNTRRVGGSRQNARHGQVQKSSKQNRHRTAQQDNEYEERGARSGETKQTFESLKKNLATIKPTLSSSLRINSLDHDLLPSLTLDTKMTLRRVKVDVQISQVPRSMENLLTSKRFTIQSQIEKEKAAIKLIVVGRGEVGAEVQLRGQRQVEAKIYDRDLLKSGETVHAEVSLELITESTIRAKIFVNPESAPKIGRAISQTAKSTLQVSSQLLKEKSEEALMTVRRIWSDQDHPIYTFIRLFVRGGMEEWKQDLMRNAQEWKSNSMGSARAMYDDSSLFGTSLKEVVRKIDQERKKWMQYVMDLIENTPAGAMLEVLPNVSELSEKVNQALMKHFGSQMQILKSRESCLTLKTCDSLAALRSAQELAIELVQSIDKVKARQLAEKALDTIKELLLDAIKALKDGSNKSEAIKSILSTVDIQSIETAIRNADTTKADFILEATRYLVYLVKTQTGDKLGEVMQKEGDKIVLTIPHPFRWNNFKELPKLTEEHMQKVNTYIEKSKRAFRDIYDDDNVHIPIPGRDEGFRFKWSDAKHLHKTNMPTQTAMIFGERHIMTFDGKVYSIPQSNQQCTYLMARATRNEKFALVKSRDGITLTVPEMSITINDQNEVRLNNSRSIVQLPIQSYNKKTSVKLVGDTVEVQSDSGISLKFSGEKKICVVEVSSGMWDESTGLLGSNDNEADNDWKMPSGKQASHAEEFVNAFELSQGSQCQLTKPGQGSGRRAGPQCQESSKCSTFFRNGQSELNSCFQTVDANEFSAACEQETKNCNQSVTQEVVCVVVEAYRKICDIKGVETEAPEECETCDGRKENSKWNMRGNQRKVDVVVVVSEHQDLAKDNQSPAEKIRSLMDTISRKLQQWNGQDVRAALVGFSGAGVHKDGHTHTVDNKQFDSINKLPQALRTLQFNGREKTDVMEAIDFVIESHDFRPEATKIILVFGPEESQHVGGGRQQSVQEKLIEHGITVTVFAKYEELKERDLGVTFDGSILSSKSKSEDTKGEMPGKGMSRVAKATRGAIFKLDSLLGSDSTKKSQMEQRTAETILEQVKREETMCKTCVCQQTDFNQLISSCKVAACA